MKHANFADFYRAGPLKDVDQTHRNVGATNLAMFKVTNQPAGQIEVPGLARATVQLAISGNGPAKFDLGSGQFAARSRPGDWLLTPRNQACRYDLKFNLSLLVLELPDGDDSETALMKMENLHSRLSNDPHVSQLIQMIWADCSGAIPLGLLWSDAAIVTLHGLLGRAARASTQANSRTGGLAPWQVRRATEYLAANFDRPGTADVAMLESVGHRNCIVRRVRKLSGIGARLSAGRRHKPLCVAQVP
jgi:hypothetical protein